MTLQVESGFPPANVFAAPPQEGCQRYLAKLSNNDVHDGEASCPSILTASFVLPTPPDTRRGVHRKRAKWVFDVVYTHQ